MQDCDVISLSSDETSRPSSPFINISEVLNVTEPTTSNRSKRDTLTSFPSSNKEPSPNKLRSIHTLSESDGSDNEKLAESNHDTFNLLYKKYCKSRDEDNGLSSSQSISYSQSAVDSESPKTSNYEFGNSPAKSPILPNKQRKRKNEVDSNHTKEQKLQEKLRKKKEREEKKAAAELQKQMKPGNCIKFMTVNLDSSLIDCSFAGLLLSSIQGSEAKHKLTSQVPSHSITWTRELPGSKLKEEDDVLLVWDWQRVVPLIKNNSLIQEIKKCQRLHCGKIISLVLFGLSSYFGYLKSKRKNTPTDGATSNKRSRADNQEYPYLTRREIEEALIELQIMANCNHQLIESAEDLGQLVVQITKAIAETPFKLEKQRRELENLEWFAVGDSRDCVTVDKEGNGLLRLWQQQLCQFNLASHDTAQAIVMNYPSPRALMQAYEKCNSQKEGEDLLKDIQIRRTQGPLSSCRRIGPELSKKIYTFFCSREGDAPLSQEQ